MTARIGVAVMAACLAIYLVVVGQRAVMMVATGQPIAVTMGIALVVMPLIGGWALWREIRFGFSADKLGRKLDAEGGMPEAETELRSNGRLAREDVDPLVARYVAETEKAPEDWRAQYRLGVVHDAAGHRKDARAAIRAAIRLSEAPRS